MSSYVDPYAMPEGDQVSVSYEEEVKILTPLEEALRLLAESDASIRRNRGVGPWDLESYKVRRCEMQECFKFLRQKVEKESAYRKMGVYNGIEELVESIMKSSAFRKGISEMKDFAVEGVDALALGDGTEVFPGSPGSTEALQRLMGRFTFVCACFLLTLYQPILHIMTEPWSMPMLILLSST